MAETYELFDGSTGDLLLSEEMPSNPITAEDVTKERDRRIDGGIEYQGIFYQTRPGDRENIHGAYSLALGAVLAGAQLGDLYWHGGTEPFMWIAEDNSLNPMDAYTVMDFAKAAAAHKHNLIIIARILKDRLTNGEDIDIQDDSNWVITP